MKQLLRIVQIILYCLWAVSMIFVGIYSAFAYIVNGKTNILDVYANNMLDKIDAIV